MYVSGFRWREHRFTVNTRNRRKEPFETKSHWTPIIGLHPRCDGVTDHLKYQSSMTWNRWVNDKTVDFPRHVLPGQIKKQWCRVDLVGFLDWTEELHVCFGESYIRWKNMVRTNWFPVTLYPFKHHPKNLVTTRQSSFDKLPCHGSSLSPYQSLIRCVYYTGLIIKQDPKGTIWLSKEKTYTWVSVWELS